MSCAWILLYVCVCVRSILLYIFIVSKSVVTTNAIQDDIDEWTEGSCYTLLILFSFSFSFFNCKHYFVIINFIAAADTKCMRCHGVLGSVSRSSMHRISLSNYTNNFWFRLSTIDIYWLWSRRYHMHNSIDISKCKTPKRPCELRRMGVGRVENWCESNGRRRKKGLLFYVEHLFLYLINLHDDDCYFAGEKREEKKIFVQMKFSCRLCIRTR